MQFEADAQHGNFSLSSWRLAKPHLQLKTVESVWQTTLQTMILLYRIPLRAKQPFLFFLLSFAQTWRLNLCLGMMQACLSSSVTTAIHGISSENMQGSSVSHSIKASQSLGNVHLRYSASPMLLQESGLQSSTSRQNSAVNDSTNSNSGFVQRKENITQSFKNCFPR